MSFLACYMTSGVLFSDDNSTLLLNMNELETKFYEKSKYYADLIILDENMKKYKATEVSCILIYIIRQELNILPLWRNELTELTKYNPIIDLNELYQIIINFIELPEPPNDIEVNENSENDENNHIYQTSNVPTSPDSKSFEHSITMNSNSNCAAMMMTPAGKENIPKLKTSPVSISTDFDSIIL